jgi:endonuclease YncB( thermonuclease family)
MAQEGGYGLHFESFDAKPGTKAEDKKETKEPEIQMPAASSDFSELRSQGVVLIQKVIDPLRVQLQDGRIVQLASLEIPDNNAGIPGPVASKAFEQLKTMLENKQATFYQTKDEGDGRRNRMGHYLGHLETHGDKFWIQGVLIKNGLARIQPSADNTEMAAQMITLENEAIKEKRGIWASDKFGVLTPENAASAMNSWAIVEGKITKTGMSNNTVFLNFAEDWRKDFTIGIEGEVRRQIAKKNLDSMSLGGKRVRVHGWVEDYNGPYIKLSNAIWLEILPDSLPDAAPPANLPKDN